MARPKEFNEEKVLDKAMELFWLKGYEATSMQDLVEHMGISRGSLYDTFGDKHTLFLAALDHYKQRSYNRFLQNFDQAVSVKEAIANFFNNIVDEAMTDAKRRGCFMTNSTIELAPHDSDMGDRAIFNQEHIEEIIQQALIRAQKNGEISKDADTRALARFFFNSVQGLRVVSKITTDQRVLEDIVRVTLSILD